MYNITFQQIETFLTVAKSLNLSKAAALLSFSQPALSKMLKKFEESVGMKLFTSSNQGMRLTVDGEYLLSVLEPQYRSLDHSIYHAQLNSQTPAKVLHIVEPSLYDNAYDFDMLKDIVSRYESKYPDVLVRERLCDFAELRKALDFGEADFVFTEDFAIRDLQNISIRRVKAIDMFLAISNKHPLAQSDALDFSALSGETFFTITTLSEQVDTEAQLFACSQLGFTPKKIEILPNFQTLMHMINLGKGVSLSAKLKIVIPEDCIRYYPIKLATTPSVAIAWRDGKLNRHVKNFIDMLPETTIA
jgi:DNA-binding transcriptional LysR family regulator